MKGFVFYLLSTTAIFGAGTASAQNALQDFLSRAETEIRQSVAEARDNGWRTEVRGEDRDDDDDDDRDDDDGDDDDGDDDGDDDDNGDDSDDGNDDD